MHTVDVAILGGGPAGLSSAISIKRACSHLNVKVYERVQSLKPRGAAITVDVNGCNALTAIDPALRNAMFNTSRNPRSVLRFDEEGELVANEPLERAEAYRSTNLTRSWCLVAWSDMQQTMADHLAAVAGPDVLQLGAQFDSMHVEEDGVLLDFGGTAPPVKARVVLGADGYRSKVRQLWLDDGPAEFAGTVIWRGMVPEEACPLPPESFTISNKAETVVSACPGSRGWTVWNASASLKAMEAAGVHRVLLTAGTPQTSAQSRKNDLLPGAEIKERALKVFKPQPRLLQELMQATTPEVMLEHDVCFRPSSKLPDAGPLGSGPVSLVGDAAHAKRPNGQGLSQALEDALELGHRLRAEGPTEAALRAYESARMARWKFVAAVSEASAKASYVGVEGLTKEEAALRMVLPEIRERVVGVKLRPLVGVSG